jgi:hypothetical protein
VEFADATGVLTLADTGGFQGFIGFVQPGDKIDLPEFTYDSTNTVNYNASSNTLSLSNSGGTVLAAFQLLGDYTGETFYQKQASGVGLATEIQLQAACFTAGTRLLTGRGEVEVQAVRPGDRVATLSGRALRVVRWVGHTSIDLDRHPGAADVAPIRLTANAFAPGVPHRDLLLSPDHAVAWGGDAEAGAPGVLIPAHLLVNGASIRREPARGCITYFHVELDRHDVLLAEGLPAESYLDTGNRALFAGAVGARDMHPDLCAALSARAWDERACAVLQLGGDAVRAAHGALLRRAVALGHRRTGEPGLRVSVDGRAVACATVAGGVRVALPAGAREVRLESRVFVPCELDAGVADGRRLGVPVAGLRRDGRLLSLRGSVPTEGWHPMMAGDSWRWTDGAAVLRVRPLPRASVLEVRLVEGCGGWVGYWDEAAGPRPGGQQRVLP